MVRLSGQGMSEHCAAEVAEEQSAAATAVAEPPAEDQPADDQPIEEQAAADGEAEEETAGEPEPMEEQPASDDAPAEQPGPDEQYQQKLANARQWCAEAAVARITAEKQLADAKAAVKSAKAEEEQAVGRLEGLIRDSGRTLELFDRAAPPETDVGSEDGADVATAESWRNVPIASLGDKSDGLTEKRVEKLEQTGLDTIGKLADFTAVHGTQWYREIKGFGAKAAEAIDNAMDRYWQTHQVPQVQSPAEETAEPQTEQSVTAKLLVDVDELGKVQGDVIQGVFDADGDLIATTDTGESVYLEPEEYEVIDSPQQQ